MRLPNPPFKIPICYNQIMKLNIKRFTFLILLIALLCSARSALAQTGSASEALVIHAQGVLTPVMVEYVQRGIDTAARRGSQMVILQLNTPGGSTELMNRIVQVIRGSSLPVVVYVAPNGAIAGSAGTLITLAGHLAAMAPETTIGAASPVGGGGEDLGETIAAKEKNVLKATVRALAKHRPPAAIALAEQTIETAQAASASEAKAVGLIDYIAIDLNDLLRQMNGAAVRMESGEKMINTVGMTTFQLDPTAVEMVLSLLTNPNLVFLLMIIGVQAILVELSSPGGWAAGTIGVICLALAIYALGALPVNWFGAIFMILAFVLFILDIKAPTHGALTLAGIGTLVAGALILFNSPGVPSFQRVSVPLVIGAAIFTAILSFTVVTFALRAQRAPVRTGRESLVGKTGIARTTIHPTGSVQLGGEQWSASLAAGAEPVQPGERVVVEKVEGLRLIVRKMIEAP